MIISNGNYKVYYHCTPSGKYYIGITRQTVGQRWKHGEGYKQSVAFYNAIQKYGWDNISHEVIASNLTKQEACNFEKLLIKILNTTDKNYGYNIAIGGQNSSKKEYENDICKLWENGLSVQEIVSELHICKETVATYLNKNNITKTMRRQRAGEKAHQKTIEKYKDQVCMLWNHGYTQQEIQNIVQCNLKTVRTILKICNISEHERRSRGAIIANYNRKLDNI